MTSYTNVFTGDVVQPTDVSYSEVSLATNAATLGWPLSRITDLLGATGAATVQLPAANNASVGQDCLLNNRTSYTVTVYKQDGVTVVGAIDTGKSAYVYLTDNSTANGVWRYVDFASTTSSNTAGALQGYGINSLSGLTLNQDHQFTTITATTYSTLALDRARFLNFTGSSPTTWTLDSTTATAGYFFIVRNSSGTTITLSPNNGKTIDGGATKTITATNSCEVHYDGTNWFSIGYGQSATTGFYAYSQSVTALSGTVAVSTLPCYGSNFITLTGTLNNSVTLEFPTSPNLYVLFDDTTHGANTLSIKAVGGAVTYVLTEDERMVFYTDGGNMLTAVSPTTEYVETTLTAALATNATTDQAYALAMSVALG